VYYLKPKRGAYHTTPLVDQPQPSHSVGRFCVHCGKLIPDVGDYCPFCGAGQPKT